MKRRQFIKNTAASLPLLSYFPASLQDDMREKSSGLLEKRALGNTGEKLSIIGFGGIVVKDATPTESKERVAQAIDYGVNYFDVAPTYGDAEIKLGPALQPYRSNVFLACKTTERNKKGARKELEQSLKRLHTDHLDLYQLHAVNTLEDIETIFSQDGAMETFLKARDEGKVRFIGFSSHSVEAAMALLDRFAFNTILFPVNYTTWYAGNFGSQVLVKAHNKGLGILALKSMVKGPYPKNAKERYPKCWYQPLSDPKDAKLGLRFTLSHPVTAAIPPGNENLFKLAMDLALKFRPLKRKETKKIKELGMAGTPLFNYPTS